MQTHADIVRKIGAGPLHEELGISLHTVRSWAQRKSIPAEYWPAIVRLKAATLTELIATATPRRRRSEQAGKAA